MSGVNLKEPKLFPENYIFFPSWLSRAFAFRSIAGKELLTITPTHSRTLINQRDTSIKRSLLHTVLEKELGTNGIQVQGFNH